MKKSLMSIVLASLVALSITGCNDAKPQPKNQEPDFRCHQDGVLAPEWTCNPTIENGYAGLGIAPKSAAGMNHMRREALANARSDLAQQIQTQVKDKVEAFTRTTGVSSNETVDKVVTSVTKQVAKVDLSGSKQVKFWQNPKTGAIYVLVAVPSKEINEKVKEAVKSSFKNDNALWQQFQAKQALDSLDKEFPTE